jgi:hypothetical protein
MYVYRSNEASSCNHCCSGKAGSITYSECVFVALGIQHTMRMRRVFICACTVVQISFTLSHKRLDFRKKFLDIKFVFWFSLQLLFETFLVLRRTERDAIISVHSSSSRARYSCQSLMKLELSRQILEKTFKYKIS